MERVHYVVAAPSIRSCKEGEVINKENVGNFGPCLANFDRKPTTNMYLCFNASGESIYTYDEDVGRHRVSCLMPLVGLKYLVLLSLTNTEMELEVTHDRISLVMLA